MSSNRQLFEKIWQILVTDLNALRELRTYLAIHRLSLSSYLETNVSLYNLSEYNRRLFMLNSFIIALDLLITTVENNLF